VCCCFLLLLAAGSPVAGQGEEPALRAAIAGALVRPEAGRFVPYRWTQEPEIVALYFGAGWCAPCHAFVPKLAAVYERLRGAGVSTEVVFVSLDHSEREMRRYMERRKMPWPAIDRRRLASLSSIRLLAGKAPPNLVLIDRSGRVLANAWAGDHYAGPSMVLAAWIAHFSRRSGEDEAREVPPVEDRP